MKVSEIIGHKVFTMNSGAYIDDIDDVIYDPQSNMITALLIDKGGWFSDAKVILYQNIQTIGKDAVLIATHQTVQKASQLVPSINEIIKGNTYLTNTKVLTKSGANLGTISDLLFDPKTGKVDALEVSQGALKNIQSGKKQVPINHIVTIGKDRIIVKSEIENQMNEQAQHQGLQGAAKYTQSKGGKAINSTKKKSKQSINTIQSGVKSLSEKAKETFQQLKNK